MIIFFGPAGAGKSIQGQMLAARHDWRWLSAGQLLRDTRDPKLSEIMAKGELVPDDTADSIIGEAIKRARDIDHVILDGFPRNVYEAEWLLASQEEHERAISVVIVLNVPGDEVYKRLALRGRPDDTPEVINNRLQQYAEETGKVLDLLTKHGVTIELVDGVGTVGEVHDRIEAVLAANGIGDGKQ